MILNFEKWNTLHEAENTISDVNEISEEIKTHLSSFIDEKGEEATFESASEFIASVVEGWELSKEDFDNAKELVEGKKDEFEDGEEDDDEGDGEDDDEDEGEDDDEGDDD